MPYRPIRHIDSNGDYNEAGYQLLRLLVFALWSLPLAGFLVLVLPPIPNVLGIFFIVFPVSLLLLSCLLMARENVLHFIKRR